MNQMVLVILKLKWIMSFNQMDDLRANMKCNAGRERSGKKDHPNGEPYLKAPLDWPDRKRV